jgi:addiction module RelB/DinJ family antitoxin
MKTLLTIKTDKTIKETAQDVAQEIGVPLSTVINSFLKQFVRDREVVFSASYNPSEYTRNAIALGEKEYAEGKTKKYKGLDSLMRSLKS